MVEPEENTQQRKTTSNATATRIWRACLECRKRKTKCDGADTCKSCRTRNRVCEYPETVTDNASSSRQQMATLGALCEKMEGLVEKLAAVAEGREVLQQSVAFAFNSPIATNNNSGAVMPVGRERGGENGEHQQLQDEGSHGEVMGDNMITGDPDEDLFCEIVRRVVSKPARDKTGHMVMDSYGNFRYVGGMQNFDMIEALENLNIDPNEGLAGASPAQSTKSSSTSIEIPFFVRGKTFRRLPCLPRPSDLSRPPKYISDLLINIYFDQLHYTMPIIYKPHFLERYNEVVIGRSNPDYQAGFLSVFFAVCACASALLPQDPNNGFPGEEFYNKALILHFGATGEGSIEHVQCLALLSMCSAGWNTLAQSWKFAGQAVRSAQDLGLHRSHERPAFTQLEIQIRRRIWWSVYGLDRILSITLGRPSGIFDFDCDCEIPMDLDDRDMEIWCSDPSQVIIDTPGTQKLTGFIAFSKLCQIAGKIVQSTRELQILKDDPAEEARLKALVAARDAELAEWLHQVPDSIKFAANNAHGGSDLTICVITFIFHAGSIINLHRPLIPDPATYTGSVADHPSYIQCMSAARSCIRASELLRERVPPSHHLSFCVHHLALSGITLLRNSQITHENVLEDVLLCTQYIGDLEHCFSGASKYRVILQELMRGMEGGQVGNDHDRFMNFGLDMQDQYMLGDEIFTTGIGGMGEQKF